MFDHSIAFEQPWWLLLLAVVPLIWVFSFRSLAGLGRVRRMLVLALRTAVVVVLIFAIAGIQSVRSSDRLTVIYLLDQSASIPVEQRELMVEYVNQAIADHRKDDDRVGVIVFGRDAAMEIPPFDTDVQIQAIESPFDPEFTNLEAAMKLAEASFPEDAAKRIVVVSDGQQNLGNAQRQAKSLADNGIGIDVRPIRYSGGGEVIVEKLTKPADIRKGQPFDLRAVITNTNDRPVSGKLIFRMQTNDEPQVLNPTPEDLDLSKPEDRARDPQRVVLKPGKNVITLRQTIDRPNFYRYEAVFVPDNQRDDSIAKNNTATDFTHVRGAGQVLVIEDYENKGEHDFLVDRLRANNLEVTLRTSDQPFSSLPELQQFDTIVMANVPREHFTDSQIKMLVSNTQHLGCGIVMLGGPNSYGAGGWTNTELEKAMPLDFQIRNSKVMPKGALALLMHASEMAQGNYWQKLVAREAIKALGNQDYAGVCHWNGNEQWLWNHPRGMVKVGGNRNRMLARLDRMTPGDMPDFDPTMKMAIKAFNGLQDAAIKHMVIISDGDPTPPSAGVVRALQQGKITVSTVAVGTHGPAGSSVMQRLSSQTGGKYYQVRNRNALPRIFQKEARRVARPLVYETPPPFSPQIVFPHEMVTGIEGEFPPISGYVLTSIKRNPLVEVVALAPRPTGRENAILASWTYGVGKAVCLTTDAGKRWSNQWTNWENYDKFFTQVIRWSMRPADEEDNFTVAVKVEDNKVRVYINALDKDDEYVNLLDFTAGAVRPDQESVPFDIKQVAPGRYMGEFTATDAGPYLMSIIPGAGKTPIRTGINVPYSSEFRQRGTDEPLLKNLAAQEPEGGVAGRFIDDPANAKTEKQRFEALRVVNSFRHDLPKATSSQDAWPAVVLIAATLFFLDVFQRRVQIGFAWLKVFLQKVVNKVRGKTEAEPSEYMSRLRSRKEEVSETIQQRRSAARFEPQPDEPVADAVGEELRGQPAARPPVQQQETGLGPEAEQEGYTSRLLKAKKRVWQDRKED